MLFATLLTDAADEYFVLSRPICLGVIFTAITEIHLFYRVQIVNLVKINVERVSAFVITFWNYLAARDCSLSTW